MALATLRRVPTIQPLLSKVDMALLLLSKVDMALLPSLSRVDMALLLLLLSRVHTALLLSRVDISLTKYAKFLVRTSPREFTDVKQQSYSDYNQPPPGQYSSPPPGQSSYPPPLGQYGGDGGCQQYPPQAGSQPEGYDQGHGVSHQGQDESQLGGQKGFGKALLGGGALAAVGGLVASHLG
jgi:hypothetical protein